MEQRVPHAGSTLLGRFKTSRRPRNFTGSYPLCPKVAPGDWTPGLTGAGQHAQCAERGARNPRGRLKYRRGHARRDRNRRGVGRGLELRQGAVEREHAAQGRTRPLHGEYSRGLGCRRNSSRHCEPTGSAQAPPDNRLREAIQGREEDSGLSQGRSLLTPSPWRMDSGLGALRRPGMTTVRNNDDSKRTPLLSVLLPPELSLQFRLCPLQPAALGLR
jgi:hypothetical protein